MNLIMRNFNETLALIECHVGMYIHMTDIAESQKQILSKLR